MADDEDDVHARINKVLREGISGLEPLPQREKPDPAPAPDLPSGPPLPAWIYWYIGAWIVGVPTFIGTWIWCIAEYGFLLGVGLGWLPSLITAVVVGACWPVVAVLLVGLSWELFELWKAGQLTSWSELYQLLNWADLHGLLKSGN